MRDGAERGMWRCLCNVGWLQCFKYGCLEKQNLLCGKHRGLKSVYTVCQNVNYYYLKSTPKVSKKYLHQVSGNQPQYLLVFSVSSSTSWPFLFCQAHNFDSLLGKLPLPCPFFLPSCPGKMMSFLFCSSLSVRNSCN